MNYHRREMMISAVHSTLKWCRPLTFVNGVPMRNQTIASPVKPFETFPGHLLRLNTAVATNRTKQVPGGNQINYDTSYSRTRRKLEAELNKNRSKENNGPPHTTDKKHSEEVRGLTALVSFPGSGNTWLRYLLQQSTGEWVVSCWTSSKRWISYSTSQAFSPEVCTRTWVWRNQVFRPKTYAMHQWVNESFTLQVHVQLIQVSSF